MPNAKPKASAPLVQIAWITKKNGRTNVVVLTIGFPLAVTTALLAGGAHLEFVKKILRSAAVAFGLGP